MNRILTIIFILASFVAHGQTITESLIAHWPLNGSAIDESSNNSDGQVIGATITTGKDNQPGTAYELARYKYVDFGDPADFDFGATEFSISAWIYKTKANTGWNTAFICKWNNGGKPGTNEWLLTSGGYASDLFNFTIEIGDTRYSVFNDEELTLNTWYHMVAVRKTTSIELYVNGQRKSTLQVPAGEINNVGRSLLFGRFGGDAGAAVYYNQGAKIDEVMIFNRALGLQEIIGLFNGEAIEPLTPEAPANLVQNRPTDETAP